TRPSFWRRVAPAIAAAAAAALMTSTVWSWRHPFTPPRNVIRFPFRLPEGQRFTENGLRAIAISRDGTHMVNVANNRLLHRLLSEVEARPIPGSGVTEGTIGGPVFSPDGQSIAFWTGTNPASGCETDNAAELHATESGTRVAGRSKR